MALELAGGVEDADLRSTVERYKDWCQRSYSNIKAQRSLACAPDPQRLSGQKSIPWLDLLSAQQEAEKAADVNNIPLFHYDGPVHVSRGATVKSGGDSPILRTRTAGAGVSPRLEMLPGLFSGMIGRYEA